MVGGCSESQKQGTGTQRKGGERQNEVGKQTLYLLIQDIFTEYLQCSSLFETLNIAVNKTEK